MDKKITKLNKQAEKILGKGADFIIIAHKDGQCGGTALGNIDCLAHAFFSLLHQEKGKLADAVYRIIKLNAMNIIANPSPFAIDLSESIANIVPKTDE